MNQRVTQHSTIQIERTFKAAPARVFQAWSEPQAKAKWFFCDDSWICEEFSLDFRIGGYESNRVRPPGGEAHVMRALYYDILPAQRIVYSFEMYVGALHLSVSLATVEFAAHGDGTKMVFTEQVAFLHGKDESAERREGTTLGFEHLAALLQSG